MIRRYGGPLLVHLLIGLPTVVVVWCARWYAAYGHCGLDDLERPDLDGCTYDQIDHSGPVLGLLVITGLFVLALLVIAVVSVPLRRERPLRPWLLTLPAVLLPYLALQVLAR
ncbi:hypothetical protein [Streptomyces sp. NPDC005799]|uniref:hypothetical protein n=1 Tax=Streptomyces sp. NPDC005799 TaxID=3154678 RepID=UPI0033DE747F